MSLNRTLMLQRLLEAATSDSRIVGLVNYGSSSEGRADAWSDVDVALFIREADFNDFNRGWKAWAARLGDLLLAFPGVADHPWTVYDAEPLPLRVDFNFYPASAIPEMLTWPNSPTSVDAIVLYDETGGEISAHAGKLVGRNLGPEDLAGAFERVCGGFWYYLLRTETAVRRGEHWSARFGYTTMVTGNLCALLRLEAGAMGRWQASDAAAGIERAISPSRLAQLNACIPGPEAGNLRPAMLNATRLGTSVCSALAARHGWPWPDRLAQRTLDFLQKEITGVSGGSPGLLHRS